jgi:hypothetical protein
VFARQSVIEPVLKMESWKSDQLDNIMIIVDVLTFDGVG